MTQPKTSQELYALIEEATLHLALLRCQEAELAALPQAEAPQAPPPASLRRAYASRRARQALRTWGPRTLRAAAAVLLVFYLGLTTALATVPSLRHSLMTFMIHSEEEYTELALIPSGETLDIPQGWQGAYYPAYIPEGFVITHVAPQDAYIVWEDESGGYIRFDELSPNDTANIDTENAEIEFVTINGRSALLSYKESLFTITWATDTCYFILDGTLPREELLDIASHVVNVQK